MNTVLSIERRTFGNTQWELVDVIKVGDSLSKTQAINLWLDTYKPNYLSATNPFTHDTHNHVQTVSLDEGTELVYYRFREWYL